MSQNMTLVYYHVPEDQDDPTEPNVYAIHKPPSVLTLNDIRQEFPLEGTYHFRFKQRIAGEVVWLDIGGQTGQIPAFDGQIITKVTRVSWILSAAQPVAAAPPANPQAQANHGSGSANLLGF